MTWPSPDRGGAAQESCDKTNNRELQTKAEADRLKRTVGALENLEDETLKQINLQNQLQTIQEERKFENSILEQIEVLEVDGRMSEQYEKKLQEYQELLEIKIALDMLVASCCTLLEGEESRLGLSQPEDPSYQVEGGSRAKKRKRHQA